MDNDAVNRTGNPPAGQRLVGKRAIVTGAASGIGAAIVKLFSEHGAALCAYDRVSLPVAVASQCRLFAIGDVADSAAVNKLVADAKACMGDIDILVNTAGVDVFHDPITLSEKDWQRNLDVNLCGAWNFCRATLPSMLARKAGSIVNIASVHGHKIIPGAFPYPVAKHALIGLTRALGIQYAAEGVRCNSISPGLILVERIERWFSAQPDPAVARQRQIDLLPCKRLGTPEEVAFTALFLASDEARFINATDILIDGGRSQLYHE